MGTGGRRLTIVVLLTVVRDELLVPLLFPTLLLPIELATLSSVRMVRALDATTECTGKRIDLFDGSRPGSERAGIALISGLAIDSPGSLTTPSALDLALLSFLFFFFRCTGSGGTMPMSVSFTLPMSKSVERDMIAKPNLCLRSRRDLAFDLNHFEIMRESFVRVVWNNQTCFERLQVARNDDEKP